MLIVSCLIGLCIAAVVIPQYVIGEDESDLVGAESAQFQYGPYNTNQYGYGGYGGNSGGYGGYGGYGGGYSPHHHHHHGR